MFPVEQGVVCG